MANPRQRRKAKSSSHRPVSHSRHAKRNLKKTPPIRGPKALQDAWDKTKTVHQNYARLGLVASLDPLAAGGSEKALGISKDGNCPGLSKLVSKPVDTGVSGAVPQGFGKLVRDQAGNVIDFEMEDNELSVDAQTVDDIDAQIDLAVRQKWVTDFSVKTEGTRNSDESVIKELENISATTNGGSTLAFTLSGVGSRHTSTGEVKYLETLLKKHGNDIQAMAKDIRLNPEQRTTGQLKRALRISGLLAT